MPESLPSDIVRTIADAKGVKPNELDLVLADHINPDALNQLAKHENSAWTLTFELPEHEVTVMGQGGVLIDSHQETDWIPP